MEEADVEKALNREPDMSIEENQRAHVYALIGRLLLAPPDSVTLALLRDLRGDDTDLGCAIRSLAALARRTPIDRIRDEYHDLFIGLAHGEVVPYASVHLTGFLHERPLADLRSDMIRLGMRRRDDVFEPEDHIGSLCEMMAGLITGAFGERSTLFDQKRFYERHLSTWGPRFFRDLEGAKSAAFYMPVGAIGRLFFDIESAAFAMGDGVCHNEFEPAR